MKVVSPQLAPADRFPVGFTADLHEPELLGPAPMDRRGNSMEPTVAMGPEEVGRIRHTDGSDHPETARMKRGAHGPERLDDRAVHATVDQPVWLSQIVTRVEMGDHFVGTGGGIDETERLVESG